MSSGRETSAPLPALPGPRGLPLLGSIVAFGRDPLGFLMDNARAHGDLVKMDLAGWPTLLVSDMQAIETILVKEHRNFVKNENVWRHVRAVFGQGLLTSEGELWQRQRRLAAPPFAGRQLLGYGPDMVAITRDLIGRWRDGAIIDIHPEMMDLTLRVAAKAFFDSEVEEDIKDIDHAVNDLIGEMKARFRRPFLIPDWVPLAGHLRYRRAIATVERVVSRMIAERRESGLDGRADFLSRLMAARDEAGNPMSDTLLGDEARTLLLAGHETTALALSWSMHLLGANPTAQARMHEELDAVLGGREVTVDDLPALKYTESVVTEAMRVYPPAWVIGRESVGPFEAGGRSFGPGTTVFISQWVLHRDPRYYDDPEAFRPERWLDGELARRLPRFAYMPFGGGPRICIGQRFAMIEAVMLLATIAQGFAVEWQAERKITPYPSITLRPEGGVWVRLSARGTGRTLH